MVVTLLLVLGPVVAQQPTPHQVQAVVDGLRSPQHAHEAALLIGQQPGVRVCRVDHNTRNLMLQVDASCGLTREQVATLIAPLGMDVRCWTRGPLTAEPFRHLDPRACGFDPLAK